MTHRVSKQKDVLVWGITDDEDIISAIQYLKTYENCGKINLVIDAQRDLERVDSAGNIIRIRGGFNFFNITLWFKILWFSIDINLIPCAKDYNHYYVVSTLINAIFFFKKRSSISLYKEGSMVSIPIQSQVYRPAVLYPAAALAVLLLIFPGAYIYALIAIILFFFATLIEISFRIYFNKFHHIYYWVLLSFRREEYPYTSHGWLNPYGESFFNNLLFSKEGPVQNFYDIGADNFPFYNPMNGKDELIHNFAFVNTHGRSLDDPERTIFILGGSVAQGLIGDDTSYHVVLEEKLKDAGHDLKVIPWAIGGYQSTQERVLTELSLIDRKPFAILSLDFYNDAHYMMMGVPPGDTYRSQRKYLSKVSIKYKFMSAFFDYSAVIRHLWQKEYSKIMNNYMVEFLRNEVKIGTAIDNCVSIYIHNILRVNRLCAGEGIRHKTFIQPLRDDFSIPDLSEKRKNNPKAAIMNMCYESLLEKLGKLERKQEIFIDKPVFEAQDYCDEVHFTESGQGKMADIMFRGVVGWLN